MTTKTNVYVEKWKQIPWSEFDRELFQLQHRIYEATKRKDYYLIKRLQRLVLNAASSRFLAVRQVTQLNVGKRTPGVDGKTSLDCKQRFQLADKLTDILNWQHKPLRRVYISKSNGQKRPLGIPTIDDRAMQCLIKYALEPVYEAEASRGSNGFRPGRSAWDIQNNIFKNLQSTSRGYEKRILELDIEKCFDKVNHTYLMSLVILPTGVKEVLLSALRAGVLEERAITTEGTLQGGVISPLLCNIILNGIEDLWNEKVGHKRTYQRGYRFADDMIFFVKPGEDITLLRKKIDHFLDKRGLNVQEHKTQVVHATDGFDFLDWHFKVKAKNRKFVCYPSSKNRKQMITKVKSTMKDTQWTLDDRIKRVKVIYKGWRNYHQYCDLNQVDLWSLNLWTNAYLKKHSQMGRKERVKKVQAIYSGHTNRVNSFVSVRLNKSPYDNDWLYWAGRGSKRFSGPLLRAIRYQSYKCSACQRPFKVDDILELHHIDGNNQNHQSRNLTALHRSCHQHQSIHGLIKRRKVQT